MVAVDEELGGILGRGFPGSRVRACAQLNGGVSARAVVLDLQHANGEIERVVVRRPQRATPEERLHVVKSEHEVLGQCAAFGIPAPQPRYLDRAANAIVLTHLEGEPDFAPADTKDMMRQMATQLARIHRVTLDDRFGFLRARRDSVDHFVRHPPVQLDEQLGEPHLRRVFAELWPWPELNRNALLHGDYWPGNLLWKGGQLVAVLDWEETVIGDPLSDLSIARLDILWAFGEAAMHEFTDSYRAQTAIDWRNLARWDLNTALRPMSNLARWAKSYVGPPISRPDITEASMRAGHRVFVDQALASLGISSFAW